jgi:hypothetical protein
MFDQVYSLQRVISNRKEEYYGYRDYLMQGPFRWPDKWRIFFVGAVETYPVVFWFRTL